jgi:parallel beta-helix repeat protein
MEYVSQWRLESERMRLKACLTAMLVSLLVCTVSITIKVEHVKASGTIYIQSDGSVYPSDAPVNRDGNVYTLTGNINESIVIQRDNIVLDGMGLYTVEGPSDHESKGIDLTGRSNVTIRNIKEIRAFGYGIFLNMSSSILISNNTVAANNVSGVYLEGSSHNTIVGNNLTANEGYDLDMWSGSNNTIYENIIPCGEIFIGSSSNKVFRNQILSSDQACITVWGNNNLVYENNITVIGDVGIYLSGSRNCIYRNSIVGHSSSYGIRMDWALRSIIKENIVMNHSVGVILYYASSENMFFHNNFINNTDNVSISSDSHLNLWDNGYPCGGNYWSDYNGTDIYCGSGQNETGSDGVGDSSYVLDAENSDNYPLMGPIKVFNAGTWNETEYFVDVVSNSTVSDFYFNPSEGAFVKFNVTGEGFCRAAIPKDMLWVEDGEWNVLVDDQPTSYMMLEDEGFTYLYFTYNSSAKTVLIQGTNVIPEFPTITLLLTILILATVPLVITKKKQLMKII